MSSDHAHIPPEPPAVGADAPAEVLVSLPPVAPLEPVNGHFLQLPAPGELESGRRLFQRELPPWLVSAVVHVVLLVAFVCFTLTRPTQSGRAQLLLAVQAPPALPETELAIVPSVTAEPSVLPDVSGPASLAVEAPRVASIPVEQAQQAVGRERFETVDLLMPVGSVGGGLQGRRAERRAALVASRGGNGASELAVERGLRWLMAHQMPDGSWRFDHTQARFCQGQCRDPGQVGSTTASTALALLPFLGAGYTHREGPYQDTVRRGLYYLTGRMVIGRHGGDLQEGTMYAQGLATIAICEALAMTGDDSLAPYAQEALRFIVHAQHAGGGWRYLPGQPGDTTSLGWQLMALKSGQLAGLRVASPAWSMSNQFLDSVQVDRGAGYGYQSRRDAPTTSAIGLLCRMYLGWPRSHPALNRGAARLAQHGPAPDNMYFNYYATQVLAHLDGPAWPDWNQKLRDHLIATQSDAGHEAGSWRFTDPKTSQAGRLYDTTMAILTLEVYYRHLPLYGSGVLVDDGWPDERAS